MEWPELKNPRPRPEPRMYTPVVWPTSPLIPLTNDIVTNTPTFSSVVKSRRTRYSFATLSDERLGALMQLSCQVRMTLGGTLSFPQSIRPVPSAGAIHPIHVFLHRPGETALHRYDPIEHGLRQVDSPQDVPALRSAMHEVINAPKATLLLFVAEPGMTASKYEDSSSLVWRDAGVLLGMFALTAEALSLNFAPLGVTGEPWVSRLTDSGFLAGVGAAFVGARA